MADKYGRRHASTFQIEDNEFRRLCRAGVAAHNVYVRGPFIKDLASIDGLGGFTSNLRDNAPLQNVDEEIRIMPVRLRDLAGGEVDKFDHTFLPWKVG
ncbi:hypothetical protein BLN97_10855 [Bradyrhizobium elkanii]|nr:hypothetical protein BLN97_10855 [Bradyrhizobium elkanii]